MLDLVRTTCAEAAERASHVHINYKDIPRYALTLPIERSKSAKHDPSCHYLDRGEDTAAFFLVLDTINFGSGYFPNLKKRHGMSGYFTIACSLKEYFEWHGVPAAQFLSETSWEKCCEIFHQDPGAEVVQELMDLFAQALRSLGDFLVTHFNGSYVELIKAAGSSAEELVKILLGMPFFRDVSTYDQTEVYFLKRAQLLVADLALAFLYKGLGYFHDLDSLTIFADNLVPHVLRVDGILQYEDLLAARIDSEELIPAGSREEVEIRACAVHASELIAAELRRGGHPITSRELDHLLWNRGQEPYYKKVKPRHRTRTVFY